MSGSPLKRSPDSATFGRAARDDRGALQLRFLLALARRNNIGKKKVSTEQGADKPVGIFFFASGKPEEAAPGALKKAIRSMEQWAMRKKPLAIVIEDSEPVAYLLEHLLAREGFEVMQFHDAYGALGAIEEMKATPEIILLDCMLPYFNGIEMISPIRRKPGWEKIPIIMLTSISDEKNIVRALDAGASDYVQKPFSPPELMARVRRFVKE